MNGIFRRRASSALLSAALSVLLIAMSWLRPLPCAAEEPDAAFQRSISRAVTEFDAGHFAEAQRYFREAHALQPSARTLRALGMVAFELRAFAESVQFLEQALDSPIKPLDPALRKEAQSVLERALKATSRVRIVLSPADAQLSIDGTPALSGSNNTLTLDPGVHALSVRSPGRKPLDTDVRLEPGEDRTLTLALTPEVKVHEDAREARPLYKNPWLWSGVGVVVVGVVTGLAVGLSGRDTTRPEPAFGGDTGAVLTGP
jgi:tetratricopeptide (TPR) repeat protein